jgi:hypothetical protein
MNNTHHTTTTSTTPIPARHHHKRNLLIAGCAVSVLAFTSCSAAQRRAFGEQDVRDSLTSHVNQTVNDLSLSMRDSLHCNSMITVDSHVSASCAGTASSGQPVLASFAGTADVNAETCSAVLVIDIAGDRVIEQPYVQCFDTA